MTLLFISDFGDAEIECLVDHFSPVLSSPEVIQDQWTMLKAKLYLEPQQLKTLTWVNINRLHGTTCPDILKLMDLVLTIPASTAECERGFNVMKQVKSDWRSSLKPETLSDLLIVHLSSPSISEYDPSPDVELWHTDCIRSRRTNFLDNTEQCSSNRSNTDTSEDEG